MPLIIRKFQAGDESPLWEIFYNTIRNINRQDYSESQVQAWASDDYPKSEWAEKIKSLQPRVAVLDNEIVGYADIQQDGYIDHFFCHHEHQRQGVGKALMQALIKAGKTAGIERFYSHVSITAKPFFEHFGFTVVKKQEVECRGERFVNYVMEKHLAPPCREPNN